MLLPVMVRDPPSQIGVEMVLMVFGSHCPNTSLENPAKQNKAVNTSIFEKTEPNKCLLGFAKVATMG